MKAHTNGKRSRSVNLCDGRQTRPSRRTRYGFSLVELLVAIGIIVILAGILIPTISAVRKAGMRTKSASIVSNLASAVQRYQQEFGAYPGPVLNKDIWPLNATGPTMAENLVLALSGGLEVTSAQGVVPAITPYNDKLVGTGPRNLNPAAGKWNRQYPPFVEGVPMTPIGQKYTDEGGTMADDTVIPEYLDGYGDPMPILYLRASTGFRSDRLLTDQRNVNNDVCTVPGFPNSVIGQYNLAQLTPYTSTLIGVGKDNSKESKYRNSLAYPAHGLQSVNNNLTFSNISDPNSANYAYPYDAYALLGSPQYLQTTEGGSPLTPPKYSEPRQRDGFILIAAGPDRIYGTEDDVYSFGSLD